MNSFNTDADSRRCWRATPTGRADPADPDAEQGAEDLQETLAPAEWPANPQPGMVPARPWRSVHRAGDFGHARQLAGQRLRIFVLSKSDNLGATLDLGILGYIASQEVPFLMEVAGRTEADKKGGHIAQQPGWAADPARGRAVPRVAICRRFKISRGTATSTRIISG